MSKEIMAIVAGHEITRDEFNEFVQRMPQQQQAYASNPQFQGQILQQLIDMYLFQKKAEEDKLEETEEFKQVLESVKADLLSRMAMTKVIQAVTVSEEEKKAFYEENKAQFGQQATASAKHILTDTEEECLKAAAQIEAGEKTFEEAAKEYSTCPSGAQGGDLGTFGRGQMVKEFDEAVFTAEVGKVLGPVKTDFGYHLIRVDELSGDSVAAFEEVAPQIEQQLTAEKQNEVYMATRTEVIEKYGLEFK